MTIEKAMEILKTVDGIECRFPGYTTALGIAIQALEKQVPKKVMNIVYNVNGECKEILKGICPNCHYVAINKYCLFCGQALDWSDSDE